MEGIINDIIDSGLLSDMLKQEGSDMIKRLFDASYRCKMNAFDHYYLCCQIKDEIPRHMIESENKITLLSICVRFCHDNEIITEQESRRKMDLITKARTEFYKLNKPF